MVLIDVLTDLIEDQCSRRFIVVEFGVGFCSRKLIFILISCLDVLVIESSTNANFQDQLSISLAVFIFVPKSYFAVEALGRDVQSCKTLTNFLNKLGNIPQNIEVEVSILTPLTLRDQWSFDENSAIISTTSSRLLFLILFFVFEVGMEFMNPFLIHSEKHDTVGVPLFVIHNL